MRIQSIEHDSIFFSFSKAKETREEGEKVSYADSMECDQVFQKYFSVAEKFSFSAVKRARGK